MSSLREATEQARAAGDQATTATAFRKLSLRGRRAGAGHRVLPPSSEARELSFGTIVDRAGICASAGFPYIGYVLVAGDKPQ